MHHISTVRRGSARGRPRVPLGLAAALMAASVLSACTGGGTGASATPGGSGTSASGTSSPSTAATATAATAAPTGDAPATGAAATSTARPAARQVRTPVYFLQSGTLSPAPRAVTAPSTAAGALRALLAGPNASERAQGRTTAIPSGTALRSVAVTARVATVDLSGRYDDGATGASARQRLAQVVFTATRFTGIDKVRFAMDGRAVTVFGGGRVPLGRPVGRADFEDASPAVLLESPLPGDAVRTPVRVWGTANTFEAEFRLRVTDAAGRAAADVRVTAASGTGTRGAFDVTVPFRTAAAGSGTLTAYYLSPENGALVTVQRIALNLVR